MAQPDGSLPLKDIVKKVIAGLDGSAGKKQDKRLTEEDIKEMWRMAAGRVAARHSRPVSLKKGRLIVEVGDSSLLYDLTLRKTEILGSLTKEFKDKIQDIQLRIGEVHGESEKRKAKNEKRA